jgi:hypothetical protein
MQRRGIALALAVAVAGLAAVQPSQPETAFAPLATTDPRPLLGIVGELGRDQELVRIDPRSLRPLRGPRVEIFNGFGAWAFAPNRSRLALRTGCQAGVSLGTLQLVDVRRMRPDGCFAIGHVEALAWPRPSRLLVAASSPLQIMMIDPRTRRILARTPVEGVPAGTARAGNRLLVLTGPTIRQPQRLVVADARGDVRSVAVEVPPASDLVVDSSGTRAYLVSTGTVAEVDLDTLTVAHHELRERTSVLGRLLAWLVPAAQAKEFHRETRRALWLGGGSIASFGSDATIDGRMVSSRPMGLKLIDTRTWTVRTVDDQVSVAELAGDVLLATGAREIGLVAYDFRGTKRFQLFRGRPLSVFETYGGRAYVYLDGKLAPQVVDIRTGGSLGTRRAPLPLLLLDS